MMKTIHSPSGVSLLMENLWMRLKLLILYRKMIQKMIKFAVMSELYMDERLPAAETESSPYLDRRAEITVATGDLPHWHQDGKYQFVTFRLADSLPQTKIVDLRRIIDQFAVAHPRPWTEDVKKNIGVLLAP